MIHSLKWKNKLKKKKEMNKIMNENYLMCIIIIIAIIFNLYSFFVFAIY